MHNRFNDFSKYPWYQTIMQKYPGETESQNRAQSAPNPPITSYQPAAYQPATIPVGAYQSATIPAYQPATILPLSAKQPVITQPPGAKFPTTMLLNVQFLSPPSIPTSIPASSISSSTSHQPQEPGHEVAGDNNLMQYHWFRMMKRKGGGQVPQMSQAPITQGKPKISEKKRSNETNTSSTRKRHRNEAQTSYLPTNSNSRNNNLSMFANTASNNPIYLQQNSVNISSPQNANSDDFFSNYSNQDLESFFTDYFNPLSNQANINQEHSSSLPNPPRSPKL